MNADGKHKAHYFLGAITKAEDDLLRKNGLRSNMPEDWDGKEVFARYDTVEIDSSIRRYSIPVGTYPDD